MEPNCCKDDTSKAGTLSAPSAGFQESLLSLSKEDVKMIDTNNSGNLSAQELKDATEYDDIDPSKKAAISLIGQHVENSKIDVTLQGDRVKMGATLPSWHTPEFAKNQLSKDDFKLIDSNGDDILDSKELKAAGSNPMLDKMDKHAASILGGQLDAALNDPLFDLKGGVKNWHKAERSILKQVADKNATTPSVDLHLGEEQASRHVGVSKVDDRGNPTEIETSGGFSTIKYDGNNRVTDIETKVAFSPDEEPVISKIVYDDVKNTQTITTETSGSYESKTTTVNHLGKDGKVNQEDFKTEGKHIDYDSNVSTRFNENGQIVSQTRLTEDGGRTVASVEYDGKERKSTTITHLDADGAKTRESTSDLSNRLTTIKEYDKNGNQTRSIDIDRKDRLPKVKDTAFDKDGKASEVNEISYSKPYLVDKIVQRDADGNAVSTAVADWKMVSPSMGRLNSVQVTDANGETRKVDAKSKGEDAKLWRQIESKIYRHSRGSMHDTHVDEVSPGAYQLHAPSSAPC